LLVLCESSWLVVATTVGEELHVKEQSHESFGVSKSMLESYENGDFKTY